MLWRFFGVRPRDAEHELFAWERELGVRKFMDNEYGVIDGSAEEIPDPFLSPPKELEEMSGGN